MALDFDAATEKIVVTSGSSALDSMTVGTRFVWAYCHSLSSDTHFMDKRGAGSSWKAFFVGGNNRLRVVHRRGTSNLVLTSATNYLVINQWLFLAYTWDESGSTEGQRLFQGTLRKPVVEHPQDAYVSQTAGSGSTQDDSSGDLHIGSISVDGYQMDGLIAYAGIWDRCLTEKELQAQQYNPHPTSGCLGLWEFLHPTTIADFSGNGNTATVTGATLAAHVPLRRRRIYAPYVAVGGGVFRSPTQRVHHLLRR